MRFLNRLLTVPVFMALMTVLATTAIVSKASPQNAPSPPLTIQQFNEADSTREQAQRATDILKALAVSSGDWVADVGAGNGYYSQRLSEVVGPTGKVFAEDISDYMMGFLKARVKLFDLKNVELIKGDDDNPKLPASSLAAVLIVDSYHHFAQYHPMSEQMIRALKPGGRLVIADYSLPEHRGQSRADQLKLHEIDPVLVRTELEPVGFQVLKCEDPFVQRIPGLKGSSTGRADLWLMIAVRPRR
jgi:ubiquinone/menaquinone biosynthesis C-methylase UbiE